MENLTPQEKEDSAPPRDLRAELFQDLSSQFATALNSSDSLPITARQALVELLETDAPTAAEIIAAVSKSDLEEEEIVDE